MISLVKVWFYYLFVSIVLLESVLCHKYVADDEIPMENKPNAFVAFIIKEGDIVQQKVCKCVSPQNCWHKNIIKLAR